MATYNTLISKWGGRNSPSNLFHHRKFLTVILFFLFLLPQSLSAQERTDSVSVFDSIAAFDYPWLAKFYGKSPVVTESDKPVVPTGRRDLRAQGVRWFGSAHHDKPVIPSAVEGSVSLRANLLRWATLTPDLGIEWRISPSVGIMVNGSWTSWSSWPSKDLRNSQPRKGNARRYALWEVAPEVRWYLGEKKAWYVGAMFKAGQFNYKFSGTGRQGDLLGGGITGGYQLRLNKALALDFTLGLGYLNADTERYDVIDGVRVRGGKETKHWIGPINAGVTLVWKIF